MPPEFDKLPLPSTAEESNFETNSNNIENTSSMNSNAGRYDDLVNKLSNISTDKEGNDATTSIPPLQKSWVFGPKFTPKICFSIIY